MVKHIYSAAPSERNDGTWKVEYYDGNEVFANYRINLTEQEARDLAQKMNNK